MGYFRPLLWSLNRPTGLGHAKGTAWGELGGGWSDSPLKPLAGVPLSQEALLSSGISYSDAASRDCVLRCREQWNQRPNRAWTLPRGSGGDQTTVV